MKVEVEDVILGFRYRIVTPTGEAGEWATYRDIARLTTATGTYIAATDFGWLPKPLTVYQLTEVG
jgi:hypothetical protein